MIERLRNFIFNVTRSALFLRVTQPRIMRRKTAVGIILLIVAVQMVIGRELQRMAKAGEI